MHKEAKSFTLIKLLLKVSNMSYKSNNTAATGINGGSPI